MPLLPPDGQRQARFPPDVCENAPSSWLERPQGEAERLCKDSAVFCVGNKLSIAGTLGERRPSFCHDMLASEACRGRHDSVNAMRTGGETRPRLPKRLKRQAACIMSAAKTPNDSLQIVKRPKAHLHSPMRANMRPAHATSMMHVLAILPSLSRNVAHFD